MKKTFEGFLKIEAVEDDGKAKIACVDTDTGVKSFIKPNEEMFVRLQSWDVNENHNQLKQFEDKKIRVTVEEIEKTKEWTKNLPTESGYYWWRKYKYKNHSIYYVFVRGDIVYCRWAHEGLYDLQKVSDVNGEWLGPLTEPEM